MDGNRAKIIRMITRVIADIAEGKTPKAPAFPDAGEPDLNSAIAAVNRLIAWRKLDEKHEAIGTLAGGIAHDFNNLFMAILGNTSLMLADLEPDHPHFQKLKNIEQQVESGSRLTQQLLGYARKGRYRIIPVNLNLLISQTAEAMRRLHENITIDLDLAAVPTVEADQGQIEQILLNLFINAADAMPEGGEFRLITAPVTHRQMQGRPYTPNPGRYVRLTARDSGRGMDKKTLARIFDPFFTTKTMGRGTGLGLAAVYGIVKGHGGYVDVESTVGQGTTFMIYLPAPEKPKSTIKKK